jgi:hypothetical protein
MVLEQRYSLSRGLAMQYPLAGVQVVCLQIPVLFFNQRATWLFIPLVEMGLSSNAWLQVTDNKSSSLSVCLP